MPDQRRTMRRGVTTAAALATLASLVLAACGALGATFSATGTCTADGRQPGAYPDLEARVPRSIAGRPATTVDSGRNCSDGALGTLVGHDVHEVRFAGATWDEGGGNGVSIAVLALPDEALPVAWAEEFYAAGAAAGKKTDNIETSRPTYPGAGRTFRLDALNDLSYQTVVVWPDGPLARVVIVATQVGPTASRSVHDARVAEAVGAAVLGGEPSPGPSLGASVETNPGTSPAPVLPSPP